MRLGPGFKDVKVETDKNVNIYGVQAGSGPPLLLLHGYPQTHLIWHKIASQLTKSYTVIAIDLRGYGASSKPPGDDKHITYSKRIMAQDCVKVMTHLGHPNFLLCAHDRGARVAHTLCIHHPAAVSKAIILDICPTLAMYNATDKVLATAYFHWFFLIQPTPFPEKVILASPRLFAEKQIGGMHADLSVFGKEPFEAYVAGLSDPESVHAQCEDYRAAASVDMDDSKEDIKAGKKIKCPIRVLWGKYGLIEKCFDAVKEWEAVSEEGMVDGGSGALDSGHYIPEEVPEVLLKHILEFLVVG